MIYKYGAFCFENVVVAFMSQIWELAILVSLTYRFHTFLLIRIFIIDATKFTYVLTDASAWRA